MKFSVLVAAFLFPMICGSVQADPIKTVSGMEEQVWIEGEKSFPAPPDTQLYSQAIPLGTDVFFYHNYYLPDWIPAADLTRYSESGLPIWTRTNVSNVYLPRLDGTVWFVTKSSVEQSTIAAQTYFGEPVLQFFEVGPVPPLEVSSDLETWLPFSMPQPTNGVSRRGAHRHRAVSILSRDSEELG